jgi:hypothetical protein
MEVVRSEKKTIRKLQSFAITKPILKMERST